MYHRCVLASAYSVQAFSCTPYYEWYTTKRTCWVHGCATYITSQYDINPKGKSYRQKCIGVR